MPSKSGWGFKINGTKQWSNVVGFANYGYNTSEGGGFSVFTNASQNINFGAVLVNPLHVRGELGLGFSWSKPNAERVELVNGRTEAQINWELYWRLLTLRQLWITPGIQFYVNPTFNRAHDFMYTPTIKARVFF